MIIYLEQSAYDLNVVQLMQLPPGHILLRYQSEFFFFLMPIYPDFPGKEAIK